MQQILASCEFKGGEDFLTEVLPSYNKTRQSEYGCNNAELFALYPIDGPKIGCPTNCTVSAGMLPPSLALLILIPHNTSLPARS